MVSSMSSREGGKDTEKCKSCGKRERKVRGDYRNQNEENIMANLTSLTKF